jgi:LCP family protein required for cell wall assembly
MSQPQRAPRTRSAFAAAFLSLLFPGLGHAYAGAYARGLGFAAVPLLLLALTGGIVLRADRTDLIAFFAQESVLQALFVVNFGILVYRLIAAVDAWNVARFLNGVDASGGGRLGRAKTPLGALSVAGLIAVVVIMGGAHVVAARYNALALNLVECVFTEEAGPGCETAEVSPSPEESVEPDETDPADASAEPTPSEAALPSPESSAGAGTPAPTLPPWDGKERLNVLLVGSDQRPGEGTFNTDTLIVASVEPETGQVAMFQVPRDMVDIPVPANARSVWGSVYRGKVNSWYMQNRKRSDMWAGKSDTARGFNALKGLLGELYGLDIRYYVMVNFQGFQKVVNTLGGVQVNVQIPVYESTYPVAPGRLGRVYIPAGPQHMTGREALVYARSRHRSTDFDRGRRQQRVILSLREQMNAQAILANLPELIDALKDSVKTDVKTRDLPKLLALAEGVSTKDVRSYVFSPNFYATEYGASDRGYIITPNVTRIRNAVDKAFKVTPALLARRERLEAEGAAVWVRNGSGRPDLQIGTAEFLEYQGVDASAPNRRVDARPATTEIVVYNGAEADMTETIKYLEKRFGTTVTLATDPTVPVDIVITLGRDAPALDIDAVG